MIITKTEYVFWFIAGCNRLHGIVTLLIGYRRLDVCKQIKKWTDPEMHGQRTGSRKL